MLYEAQGLDFRVAPNGKTVSMRAGDSPFKLVFMSTKGEVIQLFDQIDLGITQDVGFAYQKMTNDQLIFSTTQGAIVEQIFTYQYSSNSTLFWDVSALGIDLNEYDVNSEKRLMVYSDYKHAFDQETEQDLKETPVSLYLYDLETGSKRLLVTSSYRHEFDPQWVSNAEIEFNALDGSGRDQISFQ